MKRFAVVFVFFLLGAMPLAVLSQEVISGDKFNTLTVSPQRYMNVPVTLEGTFGSIVQNFTKIEEGNNISSNMYVKFTLGRCPYPCIGMRVPSVLSSLEECGPGDLVRVTGNLKTIQEKPQRIRVRGKYTTGPSYRERIHVYGPKDSEIFFNVGSVEKGWGKDDSPKEMFEEGKGLKAVHYQKVGPGDKELDREQLVEKLVDKAIWFEGTYEGIDEKLSDLEKAAGITPEKVIKFNVKVDDKVAPCYIPYSKSNMGGFKNLPIGSDVQVYGRIRKKETPKGWIAGFAADRVMKVVTSEEAPQSKEEAAPSEGGAAPAKQKEEAPSPLQEGVLPPPPP